MYLRKRMRRLSALQARVSLFLSHQISRLIYIFRRLNRHRDTGAFSRDDDGYMNKYYRAHGQPSWAIFGLFSCIIVVIFGGWPAIYLLSAGEAFLTQNQLKPKYYLAADVAGAYSGVSEIFSDLVLPIHDPEAPSLILMCTLLAYPILLALRRLQDLQGNANSGLRRVRRRVLPRGRRR
jgi:hypothetical protein